MKRKIIRQGHNTMTITLPSEWVRRFNLNAGSEVDMIERDNGLFLSTEKNHHGKKTEFDISGMDIPTIWKYFMAVYREGYDEIKIKFPQDFKLESPYKFFTQHRLDAKYGKKVEKQSPLEFFHSLVNRFVGMEIVEHGKDFVVIKELTEPTSKEFENSLRRVFLLIQEMVEETHEALKTNNPKLLSHIHDVDINLDKFHDYCIRVLNKIGNKDNKKTALLFSTLFLLELIGDELKTISHHLLQDFSKIDFKEITDIIDSINEELLLYYDLFYKFDKEKVIRMSELDKQRYFNVTKKKIKRPEAVEIFHHLRIIARYINALIELRVEMEF